MAFIDAYYGIDLRFTDFNQLVRFGYDSIFLDNENIRYRGITHQDILEVDWHDGRADYASIFGGRDVQVDSRGNVEGGTVTGYLELVWNGADYEVALGIEKINVSAERIYDATLTRSRTDDTRVLADILAGDDRFSLSGFDDFAKGLTGNDTMAGLGGDDTLVGGAGRDRLFGGGGADRLAGGGRDDNIVGGGGDDRLLGNSGNDRLNGGGARDTLNGGGGDDTLNGGGAGDSLNGGGGRDRLIGANGNDTLRSGGGEDTFVFDARDGMDRVIGFRQGEDLIEFRGADGMRDLDISQRGNAVAIEYEATTVILARQDADDFTAGDFPF